MEENVQSVNTNTAQNVTKQTIWERRLLDLSLRNSLLNFRPGSSCVQLMTSQLAELEDKLSDNESFLLSPAPQEVVLQETEYKTAVAVNAEETVQKEFRAKRLCTCLTAAELEKTLKKLHRQAKVSLEENGANTLYLAVGFLRWYESDKSEKPRLAPLVLLPVELTRKIQNRTYSLRLRDEDPQMNITLLELLRQDHGISIPGLSPLPEDEHGVNIPLVFNTVRECVQPMSRWGIVEAAFLGQFSFNRFIMWNDIRTRCEDLKQNKVVASLISGKMEWQAGEMIDAKQLDNVPPSEMAIPSSADSSQLAAVYDAAQGMSFVLHGAPGTGKSQTITNMIANALYNKKTVLFVAEKMAALTVVQKRLAKIGLDPFCLELHSNKTQKRAVLSQLEKTLGTVKTHSPGDYAKTAEKLLEKRKSLNETMTALHKKLPCGFSLYELLVMFEENRSFKGRVNIPAELVREASESSFENWIAAVNELVLTEREAGGVNSPFRYCGWKSYSTELRDRFSDTAKRLVNEADGAKSAYESAFGASPTGISIARACADGIKAAENAEYVIPLTAESAELHIRRDALNAIIADGHALGRITAEINGEFDPAVSGWNAGEALLKWKAAEQKWALAKSMDQGKLLKEMAVFRKAGKPSAEQFVSGCEKLAEQKRLSDSLAGADPSLTAYFGALWSGAATDFARLERCFAQSAGLNEIFRPIRGTDQLKTILSGQNGNLHNYAEAFGRYEAAENELKNTFAVDFTGIYGEAACCFEAAKAEAASWLENIDLLRERCALLSAKDKADAAGLSFLTSPLFKGELKADELEPALKCAFAYAAANAAISSEVSLSSFRGAKFEDSIAAYKELTSEFEKLTVKELTARLSEKIPDTSAAGAGSSELAILLKAIKSGGRMMSIRKLFDSIPTLLRRICPCMLMSPISVAQYIDPAFPKFDLVIFDEASQLPTSEAAGAIARGENAVIVGDPKQLPPTTFFMTEHTDEENAEIDDLESVLDDCLALAMPQKHLEWHYRSRHESLISYSNAMYYENALKTFPSPDDLVSRVSWVNTGGYYDKGGSKQNLAEAQAVVAEIVRRLYDPRLRKESIGVVTFSLVQQILIDDLLSEEFRKDPKLEDIADKMYEPILVKNLENIQGDERDVILFSVGYGPDRDGSVSMNFGPLNRDGGWRRLNVAITRARVSMTVFSTVTPEQIDLSKTSSEGLAGLKGFLEFARRDSAALPQRQRTQTETEKFAAILSGKIQEMGYETRCNIGSSEYRIDVGVINPDAPDEYILGIQCDGRRYVSSGSVRDRCIVQPGVLDGLDWNIHRVWMIDVFDSGEKTLSGIKAAIEQALKKYREKPAEASREEAAPEAPAVPEPLPEPEPSVTEAAEPETKAFPKNAPVPYTAYNAKQQGVPEDFYKPGETAVIGSLCEKIIAAEAPVSRRLMLKKVLNAYGITRSTAKAEKQFDEALAALPLSMTSSDSGVFYWAQGMSPVSYALCRVPASDSGKRTLDDICPQEIANGVKLIIDNQISMSREDLVRETAKLFGYSRIGGAIEAAATEGIDAAVRKGFVKEADGRISIAE